MADTEKVPEEIKEFAKEFGVDIGLYVDSHQPLLFRKGKKGIPFQDGGGVLVKFNSQHFLISAAHVTDDLNGLWIYFNQNELKKLNGALLSTPMPDNGNRNEDRIDLSVLKFFPEDGIELEKFYRFLDINKIQLNHTLEYDWLNYLIVGTPSNQTKVNDKTRNIDSKGMIFFTQPSEHKFYEKYEIQLENHILVKFPKKIEDIVENKNQKSTDNPEGISGTGLWNLVQKERNGKGYTDVELVGIMIEFQNKYHRAMVASRIDLVMPMLIALSKMEINKPEK